MWSVTSHYMLNDWKRPESWSKTLGVFHNETQAHRFAIQHEVYLNVRDYGMSKEALPYTESYAKAQDAKDLEELKKIMDKMYETKSKWLNAEGEDYQTGGYTLEVQKCPIDPLWFVEKEKKGKKPRMEEEGESEDSEEEFVHYMDVFKEGKGEEEGEEEGLTS